jgi:hypothetical protein
VYFNFVDKKLKVPSPSAFNDRELSCDWDQHSTPLATRLLIGKEFKTRNGKKVGRKNPDEFFICSFPVSSVLALDLHHTIRHDPVQFFPKIKGTPNNRAHSLVISENWNEKTEVKIRASIARCCKWEIFDEQHYLKLKTPPQNSTR